MPFRECPRHRGQHPCSCAMGNLYRFVEPVLLYLLKRKRRSYGYELASETREHGLTDAEIEVAALYRTLRQLEQNGCVTSEWDVDHSGPARRVYALTKKGEHHLGEWITVLDRMSHSMIRFVTDARAVADQSVASEKGRPTEPRPRATEAGSRATT
jgi:PadR family transcriptional regulator, regulatory protein PadR